MAKTNWKEVLKWDEEQLEDLRFAGYSYLRQGKYDIASTFFETLAVLDPNNSYDAQTLGALYLQLGNPMKAMQYLDKALKIEPDHAHTLLNLTKAFFMLGQKEQGLKLARSLIKNKNREVANIASALVLAYAPEEPKPVRKNP